MSDKMIHYLKALFATLSVVVLSASVVWLYSYLLKRDFNTVYNTAILAVWTGSVFVGFLRSEEERV